MRFTRHHADQLVDIVREAARREILPRFRRLDKAAIRSKSSDSDLVTDADEGAEAFIREGVEALIPGVAVVGEEAIHRDPAVLDLVGSSKLSVIVDPVDGTWNFAKGLSLFGVIVAVVEDGETVFGMLYDPLTDDWMSAFRGEGAYFDRPDGTHRKLCVARAAPLDRLSGYVPLYLFPKATQRKLAPMYPDFGRIMSLRCSCHEYRMLADGHMCFCLTGSLKPWDHAAGELVHREAGGYAALIGGAPYRPAMTRGTLLLAPDEPTWNALRARFGGVIGSP